MRIYHIKDSYMFNKNNKNGTHRYCVYFDRKTKKYRAIEMTHIYEISKKKRNLLSDGLLKEVKFKSYRFPQGVERAYFETDIDGKPIKLNKYNSRKSYCLTKRESSIVKNIAKRKIR